MPKIRVKQIEDITSSDAYLADDLLLTAPVGEVKIPSGKNYATISATRDDGSRKTVQEALEEIFTKDNAPSVTAPTATLAVKYGVGNATPSTDLTKNTYIESGTRLKFTGTVGFNPGAYEYGPQTGCSRSYDRFRVYRNGTVVEELASTGTTQGDLVLADGDTVYLDATVTHTAGAVPLSQLGKSLPDLAIAAGTTAAVTSSRITAFRKYFYGALSKTADSDAIRTLSSSSAPVSDGVQVTLSPSASDSYVLLAAPAGTVKSITALLTTSMNADISANFVHAEAEVANASGANAIKYDLFVFEPDAFQGNEKIQLTIHTK